MDRILLKSPATIANLSCGYDIFGICLEQPYDVIEIKKISSKEVVINSLDSPFSNIPTKPKENTGGVPAESYRGLHRDQMIEDTHYSKFEKSPQLTNEINGINF